MWKPGQLVTIDGIVYRVKRAIPFYTACSLCDFRRCNACIPFGKCNKPYPIPYDCYLRRLSPVNNTWRVGQLITVPRGTVYRVKKGACNQCHIWRYSPFCTICKCGPFTCLKRVYPKS